MQYIPAILLALAIAEAVVADGWDRSLCSCDDDCHHPQCCSDGKIYMSPCYVKCRNDYMKKAYGKTIQVIHHGNCGIDTELQPKIFKYCGKSDLAQSAAVELFEVLEPMTVLAEVWDEGKCDCDRNDYRPQCASDWQTYANPCFVDCRNEYLKRISGLPIYITYAGKCHEPVITVVTDDGSTDEGVHLEHLTKNLEEDDGTYHPSANEYEHENSKVDTTNLVTPAPLKTEATLTEELTTIAIEMYDESQCLCDKNDNQPQCASDWQTYANPCFVDCRNDYLRRISGLPIYITYAGKCYEPILPLTASVNDENKNFGEGDGSYHPSSDEYQSKNLKHETNIDMLPEILKTETPTMEALTNTAVEIYDESQCMCDKNDNRPQCASDWQTYVNPCFVDCRNDYLRRISGMPIYITYAGKCYEPDLSVAASLDDENKNSEDDGSYHPSVDEYESENLKQNTGIKMMPVILETEAPTTEAPTTKAVEIYDDENKNLGEDDGSYHPSADEYEIVNLKYETSVDMLPEILKTEAPTTEAPTVKAVEIYDESQCFCDKNDNQPQCASDWQTYANPCFVDCRNDYLKRISGLPIYITYAGKCYEPIVPFITSVEDENKNLLEDDGSYHHSADEYLSENLKHEMSIDKLPVILITEDPITEAPTTIVIETYDERQCLCDMNDNRPQCASDWQTYANPCFVDCRNDYLKRISGMPIFITYAGKCYEPVIQVTATHDNEDSLSPLENYDESSCMCDKYDVRPQCASDWQTYLNPCFVDCRNEYLKRISAMPIFITYAGKCYEPLVKSDSCDH